MVAVLSAPAHHMGSASPSTTTRWLSLRTQPVCLNYSTANVAEGSTVCFEILSLTLISILYTPGPRFDEATALCKVTCSPTLLPSLSDASTAWTTGLLVAVFTMSYSNVAEGL